MNLRILKKLSKRAAPLLLQLDSKDEHFPATKGDCYTSVRGHDFKHWDRMHSAHGDCYNGTKKRRTRKGGWVALREPTVVLKGTPMVGWVSGYYEVEWEERTAYEQLLGLMLEHFTEYIHTEDDDFHCRLTRRLRTTQDVFEAAHEVIAGKKRGTA